MKTAPFGVVVSMVGVKRSSTPLSPHSVPGLAVDPTVSEFPRRQANSRASSPAPVDPDDSPLEALLPALRAQAGRV